MNALTNAENLHYKSTFFYCRPDAGFRPGLTLLNQALPNFSIILFLFG